MIPATPGPKIPENGPEPEFRPEFLRNFEPSLGYGCLDMKVCIRCIYLQPFPTHFDSPFSSQLQFDTSCLSLTLLSAPSSGSMFSARRLQIPVEFPPEFLNSVPIRWFCPRNYGINSCTFRIFPVFSHYATLANRPFCTTPPIPKRA
jgi:hypothetical protein